MLVPRSSVLAGPLRDRVLAGAEDTRGSYASRLLVLWHLTSLDAPSVAALWTAFAAGATGVKLPSAVVPAMFASVWILYALDRLLDARSVEARSLDTRRSNAPPGHGRLEPRHRFHYHHARLFAVAITLVGLALLPLLLRIPRRLLLLDAALGTLLAGWFLLIHARPAAAPHRLPKELVVGVFFGAACFLPAASGSAHPFALLPSAILFAALCSLNCLFIYAWEHEPGVSETADCAHASTRLALGCLRPLAWSLAAVALGLAAAEASVGEAGLALPAIACALSSAALLLLDRRRPHSPTLLRAAADLMLLSPIVLWPLRLLVSHG